MLYWKTFEEDRNEKGKNIELVAKTVCQEGKRRDTKEPKWTRV